MVINTCPHCNVQYMTAAHSGDYIHNCENASSATLANEDVINIHTSFTDADGTVIQGPAEAMIKGIVGKNFNGLNGDGEKVFDLTTRGNPKAWYRTRRRFTYIENPEEKS